MKTIALTLTLMLAMFTALLSPNFAMAFIPRARTILGRLVKHDGSGTYRMELSLQFPRDPEPLTVHEFWLIENADLMRLTVTVPSESGGSLSRILTVVTHGQTENVLQPNGRWQQENTPADAIAPLLAFRSSFDLGKYLIDHQMAARGILAGEKSLPLDQLPSSDPNTTISMLQKTICFALGFNNGIDGTAEPHLWIDEDNFVIKKILFPSGAVLLASNHEPFAHGLMFPKLQTVNWNKYSVQIKTVSVRAEKTVNPKALSLNFVAKRYPLTASLPNLPVLRSFYQEFR